VHFILGDIRYRVYGKKEVSIPDPEEAARTNFQHPNLTFVLVNEEVADVTNLCSVPIDYLATPNVLTRLCKS